MKNLILYELYKDSDQDSINRSFARVCSKDNVERIKYLLTSPDLSIHANININHHAISSACQNGNLDLVKYLLTSPDLQEHADYETAVKQSVRYGKIEILRYLLNPSNFNIRDISAKFEDLFISTYLFYNPRVAEFFIVEMNIPRTTTIDKFLRIKPNLHTEKLFEKMDLLNKLEKDLSPDKMNNISSRFKI